MATKPTSIQGWRDASADDRKEFPADCFLDERRRIFPYKFWRDGKWVISDRMLKAAISRANSVNRPDIVRKAQRIRKREGYVKD